MVKSGKPVTWEVEVKRFFVETKERNKKGNAISVPITHRKMFVHDSGTFMDSGEYRIVQKGSGKYKTPTYTIAVIPRIPQSIWTNPSGKCETWYKLAPDVHYDDGSVERPYKRTDDKPMDEAGILAWLTARMGPEMAKVALFILQTQEPESQREAA